MSQTKSQLSQQELRVWNFGLCPRLFLVVSTTPSNMKPWSATDDTLGSEKKEALGGYRRYWDFERTTMVAYVQEGKRILHRGEIDLTSVFRRSWFHNE
ncbi:9432_t:CDS:2 [Diversispora eburnea]|uniref:9432_t:CDS:1 n=1 Tax=Diversispora eburnea TaxID=1213867 RepID=A0A9N9FD78_9GLOM|nr:9432_t:CDS:2 [Diversispora eburnea]